MSDLIPETLIIPPGENYPFKLEHGGTVQICLQSDELSTTQPVTYKGVRAITRIRQDNNQPTQPLVFAISFVDTSMPWKLITAKSDPLCNEDGTISINVYNFPQHVNQENLRKRTVDFIAKQTIQQKIMINPHTGMAMIMRKKPIHDLPPAKRERLLQNFPPEYREM